MGVSPHIKANKATIKAKSRKGVKNEDHAIKLGCNMCYHITFLYVTKYLIYKHYLSIISVFRLFKIHGFSETRCYVIVGNL